MASISYESRLIDEIKRLPGHGRVDAEPAHGKSVKNMSTYSARLMEEALRNRLRE